MNNVIEIDKQKKIERLLNEFEELRTLYIVERSKLKGLEVELRKCQYDIEQLEKSKGEKE